MFTPVPGFPSPTNDGAIEEPDAPEIQLSLSLIPHTKIPVQFGSKKQLLTKFQYPSWACVPLIAALFCLTSNSVMCTQFAIIC